MTGTGPEPPSAEDHAYFHALEAAFLRLRGKAALLSSDDWLVAQGWHRAGVPAELAIRVMEELFERARGRPRGRKGREISSLKYFRAAVESAWEEVAALSAGGRKERLEVMRVEERLGRLAESLGPGLPNRSAVDAEIRSVRGGVPEVEAALAEIDARLLEALWVGLEPAERSTVERSVAEALSTLRGRLPAEELALASRHLRNRRLRERFRLPVLSLFAPEAREPEDAS
jgi:hypothetical protein